MVMAMLPMTTISGRAVEQHGNAGTHLRQQLLLDYSKF
jgi:hypothetical protein